MRAVRYGNHRAVAVIILIKKNRISPQLIVGQNWETPLTAGELVRLFDAGQLATFNTNYSGKPWVDEGKVEEIIQDFDPNKIFDESSGSRKGIDIYPKGDINFRDIRIDYGHGELLTNYLRRKWQINC